MKNNINGSYINVNLITVSSNMVGRRIDNFLLTYLKGVNKDKIYSILRKGEVRVNTKRVKWLYRLNLGDIICVPPIRNIIFKKLIIQLPKKISKKLHNSFLYEDDFLIILNKPSGIAVHGGSGLSINIIDGLRVIRPELHFLRLVHRLDRDTSGVLLLAKNHFSLIKLHEQLRLNKIKKEYLALVSGQCTFSDSVIIAPLIKNRIFSEYRFKVDPVLGKYAKTFFKVKERFISATLLMVSPLTGRTHQIRVHAQHMGNPILGDKRYGNVFFNQIIILSGLNRLFLHAHSVTFIHPNTGKLFYIEAPMDKILLNCLSFLRNQLKF